MMKRMSIFCVLYFCFILTAGNLLFAGETLSEDILENGKWYNDEYSFTFTKNKYKAFYTVGKTNGTMTGTIKINKDNSLTIKKGKLDGDFGALFNTAASITMKFVRDDNNPKAVFYLKETGENLILWNDKSFVKAGQQITLLDNKIKCVTLGYKLSSTTFNVRIRKGPGLDYDNMEFYYKDVKTGAVKSFTSVLKGTNIRLLARTAEKMKVLEWYNNWYFIEYKEPKGDMISYKTAWMFGEFINVAENKNRQITITYPENEMALYGNYNLEITGKVTGAPVSMRLEVKNSYGNVIFKQKMAKYNQKAGTFSHIATKENESLFIGSNIFNIVALYSDDKEVSKQITVYIHESMGEKAKPVIYLYPEEEMKVSVKVEPETGFTITDPEYFDGWDVIAKPDGTLINIRDGEEYPYLFWESDDYSSPNFSTGFVVETAELTPFFREKLEVLGLNEKETLDFLEFWIPVLNEGKYYFIYFYSKERQDDEAPLLVEPEPDSVIRVFFDAKPLDAPIEVEEQELIRAEREGFSVIEWGGMRYNK